MSIFNKAAGYLSNTLNRPIYTLGGGGAKLPEFGVSEFLSKFAPREVKASEYGPNQSVLSAQTSQPYGPAYSGPQTTKLPTGGGVTGGGGTQAPAGQNILEGNVNREMNDLGAIVDRDYESAMAGLDAQESTIRGQAATSEQQIKSEYAPAKTAIEEEGAVRQQGLEGETSLATTQEKGALQQARDLFRQIQQKNISGLSGMGISSSSVAEALAERLGVETARRISGITGSANEVRQNIKKEMTRVQTYYKQKVSDLEQHMSSSIAGLQQELLSGINQINSARTVAANDKANRRAELINNAQNSIAQLQYQAQQFQQSLQEWATKKSSSLSEAQQFTYAPTDYSGLSGAISNVGTLPSVAGFNPTPNIQQESSGYLSVTPKYVKGSEEEDLTGLANF